MAGGRTAPDVQRMGLQAEKIWREAERRIMEDVIRRIKKAGEITSTADYQINRLIEMGKSREEVERIIKEALGATWPEMFEMYDKVAEWEYVRNREIYEQVNDDFLTPEDNKWLRQITEAARKQTKDTLVNMAQSYGFSVLMAGKRVFTPLLPEIRGHGHPGRCDGRHRLQLGDPESRHPDDEQRAEVCGLRFRAYEPGRRGSTQSRPYGREPDHGTGQ